MHTFTITVALVNLATGDFDFVTRQVQARDVYAAISRATAVSYAGNVWVMESEVQGQLTTWMTLDELEWHLAA